MPGYDNNDQTLGQVSCEQEQDSWNKNQVGHDKRERTDRIGQIGQGNRTWQGSPVVATGTGQPE